MSCDASFNFLEKDISTSTIDKITFGTPILEYRNADADPVPYNESLRIGQIIWEMDKDKYFD